MQEYRNFLSYLIYLKHTYPAVKMRKSHHTVGQHKQNQKLEEFKRLVHDTHADSITIQENKLTHKATLQKYITLSPCAPASCTRQGVGSSHSPGTLHSLQQTYLRP